MKNQTFFEHIKQMLQPAYYPDPKTPKARTNGNKKSGKTRRGATHVQGTHFLSLQVAAVSPAAFRHMHLGRTSKRWEKKNVRP